MRCAACSRKLSLLSTSHDRRPTRAEQRRARLVKRERFRRSQKASEAYGRKLRGVAAEVSRMVRGFAPYNDVGDPQPVMSALRRYAEVIRPWAEKVGATMIAEVNQRDKRAWAEVGQEMGRALEVELRNAPTGETFKRLLQEQVNLITSLPLEAAQRVHEISMNALTGGQRPEEAARLIAATGGVTRSRATLIARTEAARASSALTQSRAQFIGATGYIWRTAGDADVRKIHKHLEGQFVSYDDPPVAGENGERAHAGMIYNCRCWQEPVLPDVIR